MVSTVPLMGLFNYTVLALLYSAVPDFTPFSLVVHCGLYLVPVLIFCTCLGQVLSIAESILKCDVSSLVAIDWSERAIANDNSH